MTAFARKCKMKSVPDYGVIDMKKRIVTIVISLCLVMSMGACAGGLKKLSGEEIFAKISPSTVEVHAESDYVASQGTGFFIDDTGTIVTNYHVIRDCSSAYVTTNSGSTFQIRNVLGYSEELDVAILETSKASSSAVEISYDVTTGETIYVLGSSLGLTGTFSEGLVSTAQREINGIPYIQISAPISSGNSGGPVVNTMGQVIGIASAGIDEGQNLNFAIPISILEQISISNPISMKRFFEDTSEYAHPGDRVVVHGSTLAVRCITFTAEEEFWAMVALEKWKLNGSTETAMIEVMNEYGAEQGGGQLFIIDPGTFVEEVDAWCFDPSRQPGDYAIIENPYGYTICYISFLQPN